jgi:hypothetical protein
MIFILWKISITICSCILEALFDSLILSSVGFRKIASTHELRTNQPPASKMSCMDQQSVHGGRNAMSKMRGSSTCRFLF